jgi:hypothetical protein
LSRLLQIYNLKKFKIRLRGIYKKAFKELNALVLNIAEWEIIKYIYKVVLTRFAFISLINNCLFLKENKNLSNTY